MNAWRLCLFGNFQLEGTGGVVSHFGTTRAAKLLALLAFSRRGALPREDLAALLWPDDFYDATRLRLRQEIHRLRSSLRDAGEVVWSNTSEVGLDRNLVQTDLDLLRDLQRNPSQIPVRFAERLTGEFLPGWDEPWAAAERNQASGMQLAVVTAYAEYLLANGDAVQALQIAQALIRTYPCEEPLRMIAVRAYSELGSLANAVAEYQQYRRVLKDLRNEEPTAESAEQVERLLSAKAAREARASSPRNTLPQPVDPMFGRAQEVAEVVQKLHPTSPRRIVTLLGPGGIGKTRVAIEAATQLAAEFGDRVAFVTLAETDPGSDIARAILEGIGLHPPAGASSTEYLAKSFEPHPQLLVLDNVEHLVDKIGEVVQGLRQARPELRFLFTSRVRTNLLGESSLVIGPLDPMTDGLSMLTYAAESHRAISQESVLEELAKRLDGFPLAIRLAGARLRLIAPSALLEQLNSQTSILATQSQDLPERHRSLDAALAGSLAELSAEDRAALEALSGFPGGAGYGLATKAIPVPDPVAVLERLVDSALVTLDDRGPDVRFRLWGPVRDYLRTQRHATSQASVAEAAASQILAFAQSVRPDPFGPVTEDQLRRFDEEGENIQAARDYLEQTDPERAVELILHTWSHDDFRARQATGLAHVHRLRNQTSALLALIEAELLVGLTEVKEARAVLKRIDADDLFGVAKAEFELLRGTLLFRMGHRQLESELAGITQTVEEHGTPFQVAKVRYLAGVWHYFRREHDEAIDRLTDAFEGLEGEGDLSLGGRCGLLLSIACSEVGRSFSARKTMARAAPLVQASNDPLRLAYLHENQGRLLAVDGLYEEAEAKFRASLEAWSIVESAFQMADQLHSINRCLIGQERYSEAADVLRESGELWLMDANAGGLCQSLTSVAAIHHAMGRTEVAREVLGYALAFGCEFEVSLVLTEEQFRTELLDKVGSIPCEGPFTLAEAFRRIRTLPKA